LQEPPYPQAPGGTRLDIALLGQPSGRHFDPYKAEFPVVMTYPWEGRPRHQVVAGACAYGTTGTRR